jgi:monovalent cation:H+ antiporter, CPA1 family
MDLDQLIAILVTIAALGMFVNCRFFKLPPSIGLMLIGLLMSLGLIGLQYSGIVDVRLFTTGSLEKIDFSEAVLGKMLGFLLFAGAIHVNLEQFLRQIKVIGWLAFIGVILSAVLVGTAAYYIFPLIGLVMPFWFCLLFGILISPTDPIAVLAIMKSVKVSKAIETKIAGESLFNDGVSVVGFIIILEIATHHSTPIDFGHIGLLFLEEVVGGLILGLILGFIGYFLIKQVDNFAVEIGLSGALVIGGYELASALHMSGPLAVVAAGLLVGNRGRTLAMSDKTREHLDTVWEFVDESLNAILFILIGLELLLISIQSSYVIAGLVAIPLVLAARFVSVGSTLRIFELFKIRRDGFSPHAAKILTWGGLRGGISLALALSIADGDFGSPIVTITYIVVVFSILVQGLTMKPLLKKLQTDDPQLAATAEETDDRP